MPHTLIELNSMPEQQIRAIGNELKIKKANDMDLMDLSLAILDEEARIASKIPDPEPAKKKRGRPRKNESVKTDSTVKEETKETKKPASQAPKAKPAEKQPLLRTRRKLKQSKLLRKNVAESQRARQSRQKRCHLKSRQHRMSLLPRRRDKTRLLIKPLPRNRVLRPQSRNQL